MAPGIVGIGPTWLDRRQMGLKNPLGTKSRIYEQIYSNILPYDSWDPTLNSAYTSIHGGVFSLEFSPEGNLLVAACEKRSVLLFDPLTHKRIQSVENAHLDCVNCVRFLDSRSFATCSDDHTVALWDARNLNQKVRSLKGHSNWVKNIEYSSHDGLLVTSGFDGSILTWEMNTYRESGTVYNKVFSTNGLMRMRLTPDAKKMVMCTTGGYLIIIHNLDLNAMSQDLDGFKPNMYRLMQLSQTIIPVASDFTHLFQGQGKRNKLEFITDFPEGDDAEVISSLQIHPDGHCAISRNVSSNEKSEWSCVHNVEEGLSSHESCYTDDDSDETDDCKMPSWPGTSSSISTTPSCIIQHTVIENEGTSSGVESATSTEQNDLSVSPSDVWEALVAIHEARNRRESEGIERGMTSVAQMFRRHGSESSETLSSSRPHTFDSQIFVTRILPNLSSNSGSNENEFHRLRATAAPPPPPPTFRRNMLLDSTAIPRNTNERNWSSSSSSASRSFRLSWRKKLPVRLRYSSLYRRSVVGQYDRTSILRKPIYNYGRIALKLKMLRCVRLNTNYEINETRRLQNESRLDRTSIAENRLESVQDAQDTNQDCSVSSSSSFTSAQKTTGQNSNTCSSEFMNNKRRRRVFINSFCKNKSNNRIRRTSNSCGTTLTSREQRTLLISDDEGDGDGDGDDDDNCVSVLEDRAKKMKMKGVGLNDSGTVVANGSFNQEEANGVVDHEEVVEPEVNDSCEERCSQIAKPSTSETSASSAATSDTTSSSSSSSAERTILMGVFRAGNEDGVRGTSMRKHNVAAVTVSSSTSPSPSPSLSRQVRPNHTEETRIKRKSSDDNFKKTTRFHSSSNFENPLINDVNNKNGVSHPSQRSVAPAPRKIHQNAKRLTHYVEEPNLGRGFIKELCVSPDGRIICSPFGNGIRLLSFSPTVQDIFHCYPPSPPVPLHELTLNIAHTDIVISTKFSPFHNLLVSGCLSGKIIYYQPFL